MKLFFILSIILLTACTGVPKSHELIAKEKIQNNKTEAQIAKEKYLELQNKRHRE